MKIRQIQLSNFKRFTSTTITDLPETARLVLLVGPNGSGKSSLIDAAYFWHGHHWAQRGGWDDKYHSKQVQGATAHFQNQVQLEFYPPQPTTEEQRRKAVYARSAYRNDPEFQLNNLSRVEPAIREHRFSRLIDNDMAVSRNYQRLVANSFEEAFERAEATMTLAQFREQMVGEIRDATARLFPGLLLNSLGNPLAEGSFRFDKGDSKAFLYKNLSGGEKAAFDLLLDILVKRREFDDTVFFIDEPEAHMASGLQGALLSELYTLVPPNSQLWLATHSLGMMRRARDIEATNPGTVVFLDFDGVNFDINQTLRPVRPDRPFWKRAMQIALDDLAGYVAPEQVVLCEGGAIGARRNFDAECYNVIFQAQYPSTVFLGAGSADDIQNDPRGVGKLLEALAEGTQLRRVIDRDDRTDEEIAALQNVGVRVLTRRHIESYLLAEEVLTRVCVALGHPALAPQLIAARTAALQSSVAAGGPADDFKRTAGDIYNAAKELFPNVKLGSDKRAFMRGFCAPQIQTGMPIYTELRQDIFGQ
jgi:predicted ATPase